MYGCASGASGKTRLRRRCTGAEGACSTCAVFSTEAQRQETQETPALPTEESCSAPGRPQTCVNAAAMLNQSQQIRTAAEVPRLNRDQKENIGEC
jgi:uncharacterized protein YgiB involved in biofilm formation